MITRQTIYISGPMTGLPEFNYPAFHEAAQRLRNAGYTVFNPAEKTTPVSAPWAQHMREDIRALMDCHGVATLSGWTASKGARLELSIARPLGFTVLSVEQWLEAAALHQRMALGATRDTEVAA